MMNRQVKHALLLTLLVGLRFGSIGGFIHRKPGLLLSRRRTDRSMDTCSLRAAQDDDGNTSKGYVFGDLTRRFSKQAKDKVTKLTGKESYEFGDLSRWLDQKGKEKVGNLAAKDFSDYQVGDITKEVMRRVRSGDYQSHDVFLALRILLSAGASLTPIAGVLPLKLLIELVNLGLAQDLTGRLMEVLAGSLDERVKEAVTGDKNYRLGDLTRNKMLTELAEFTGNEEYTFGDISRTIAARSQDGKKCSLRSKAIDLEDSITDELTEWDRDFQERTGDIGYTPKEQK